MILITLAFILKSAIAFHYYPFFGNTWNVTEWFWQSAVVAGNYLYIDSGEFWNRSDADGTTVEFHALGGMHRIDLTQPWQSDNLTAVYIQENASTSSSRVVCVRRPSIWYDSSSKKLFKWGGWPYNDSSSYPQSLWSLSTDNNGYTGSAENTWSETSNPSTNGLLSGSLAPRGALYTVVNNTLFALGRILPSTTNDGSSTALTAYNQQGLVTFGKGTWANHSSEAASSTGYMNQAGASYIPQFGSGFLTFVRRQIPGSTTAVDSLADMSNIALYDVVSGAWYSQLATGDIPSLRMAFCSVGALSGDSFEIFIYGVSTDTVNDQSKPKDDNFLEVFVPSIPAFRWFKTSSLTPVRRANHGCVIIGNRQMLSVGGNQPSSSDGLEVALDLWVNGLGIFDMTDLEWVSAYDPNAGDYENPAVVKNYYNSDNYTAPTWSNPALADAFTYRGDNTTHVKHTGSDTGAIAGGVLGGVVGLVLIALIAVFFVRRYKRHNAEGVGQDSNALFNLKGLPEYTSANTESGEEGYKEPRELPGRFRESSLSELAASRDIDRTHELAA